MTSINIIVSCVRGVYASMSLKKKKNCEQKLEAENEYDKIVPIFCPDGVKLTGDPAF